MKKILVTCPPMIGLSNFFIPIFKKYKWKPIIPKFTQTLSENEICKIIPDCDGWIIGDDKVNEKILRKGKEGKLKAAVKWGAGVDNIDFKACKKQKFKIPNTPNMFGKEVAEVAIGYMICLTRNLVNIDRKVRKNVWYKPQGISLKNKVAGIVGFGDIGKNLSKLLLAFGLKIIIWDPSIKLIKNKKINLCSTWPKRINECDLVFFTCSLNESNFHMFNKKVIKKCKKNLKIINVSRGQLINQKDLIFALKTSRIESAALDVFENEPISKNSILKKMNNVILGSHNSSNTKEAVERATAQSIKILHSLF